MRSKSFRSVVWMPLIVVALVAAFAAPAGAQAPARANNVDVTASPGNEAEDAVAVNPRDPRNVVAMSTLPDTVAGLAVGATFDGGATWTRQVIGADAPLGPICCDEQMAFDRFGNLWVTYLVNTSANVFLALSTDGGLTFHVATQVVPTSPPGSRPRPGAASKQLGGLIGRPDAASADQPSISTGPDSVWVSYTSSSSVVIQAAGADVTGLGQFGAFTPPETVPTGRAVGDYGDTAVGPHGQVMVTYQDQTGGERGTRIFTAVDPDGLGPDGFSDPVLLATSRVGGFDYIPAQPDRSVDAEANLGFDRSSGAHNGRVYAVWTQETPNESNNMDIMLQYSDDGGATWTPAVRLNDDHGVNSQFDPSIAVDQTSGGVAVSWYDARNDLGTGGSGDTDGIPNDDVQVWATYSTDGGSTWVPNFRVSQGTSNAVDADSGFDYGDYTHAAFDAHRFYPVWSDNSNSTGTNPDGTLHQLDLYLGRIRIP
ncbi:MAG TPA: sialidase family protein [Actinomycetota bacterium]|jgi:hypothetical protein